MFAFDPKWKGESPFIKSGDEFRLKVKIGPGTGIVFPTTLDAKTPIILNTKHGAVRQYLAADESFKAALHGRYLVYQGNERAILYRWDVEERQLREFVYLPEKSSLADGGQVVQWRFEDFPGC